MIAEGVETVDHGLMLLQMGCELAQGYGIARPMPASELPAWVAHGGPIRDGPMCRRCMQTTGRCFTPALSIARGSQPLRLACRAGAQPPPPLDPEPCRIGAWLNAEKQSARGKLCGHSGHRNVHGKFHALAAEIFESQAEGHNARGLGSVCNNSTACTTNV